jgi:hypothetical protein
MEHPDLPTMVDAATVRAPCRPGAWGSKTNCAVHEGLPLDEQGLCFWGQEASPLEKAVHAALTAPPAPPSTVRRLGTDDDSMQLLDATMLRRASVQNLLCLARALDVPIPRAPRVRLTGAYSPAERARMADEAVRRLFVPVLAAAIADDRAKKNPIVDGPAQGPLRTVG